MGSVRFLYETILSVLILQLSIYSPAFASQAVNGTVNQSSDSPIVSGDGESHDELVAKVARSLGEPSEAGNNENDSVSLALMQSVAPLAPPKSLVELAARVHTDFPGLFSKEFLDAQIPFFERSTNFLGGAEERDTISMELFSQWIYLEAFKAYRLDYFLSSFGQAAIFEQGKNLDSILQEFDRLFPSALFDPYENLKAQREQQREWIVDAYSDKEKLQELKDYSLGTIEAAYLSLSLIDSKRNFDRARFGATHERFEKAAESYEEMERLIRQSNAALLTEAYSENVDDDGAFLEDLAPAHRLKESALNDFVRSFESNMKGNKSWSVNDLVDFLSGPDAEKLGIGLAKAFEHPAQKDFRKKVAAQFYPANAEVLDNLRWAIENHRETFSQYDFTLPLVQANTAPARDSDDFKSWLVDVFRETHLHAALSEDFPYLQNASERLSAFAISVLTDVKRARSKNFTWLATALAFSPVGGSKVGISKIFASKWPSHLARFSFLAIGATASGAFLYDTVAFYMQFRETQRLARLSLNGVSLTDVAQEKQAFFSVLISGIAAGWTGIMTYKVFRGFWKMPSRRVLNKMAQITKRPAPENLFLRSISRTWRQVPIEARVFKKRMKDRLTQIIATLKKAKAERSVLGAAKGAKYLGPLSVDAAALMTEVLVTFPASIVGFLKSWIGNISANVYKGLIFGTVMTTMGVLVYHYISAASVKFFVASFKKLGLTPPTLLLQNSLDSETRIERDSALMVIGELLFIRRSMSDSLGFITMWNLAKSEEGITAEQRADLDTAIEGRRRVMKEDMMLLLAKWYQRIEYRRVYNSMMKEAGFGLVATPNMEHPTRMTVLVRLGRQVFKYQNTAEYFDNLRDRDVIPDFNLPQEELESLVKNLQVDEVTVQ